MHRRLARAALLTTAVAACGEGEVPSLVGTWREIRSWDQLEATRSFRADGTFSADHDLEGARTEVSGRYQVSLTNVGFPDSHLLDWVTRICDFEVTEDRLMLCALRPTGAVDGVIGSWRGFTSYRDAANELHVITQALTLNVDGSATFLTADHFDQQWWLEGSWSMEGEVLRLATSGGSFELGWMPGAIGMYPAERVE